MGPVAADHAVMKQPSKKISMISFVVVGSGSKGNATVIYDEKTAIQIDMGLPLRQINISLMSINKTRSDLQGILITHEHIDHIGTLDRYRNQIPIYASEGTLRHFDYEVIPEDSFDIGTLTILPFSTSHDAVNPMGYVILSGGSKLVYMTDTGCVPDESLPYIKNADYYIVESNHDLKMLMDSDRPAALKRRIHSDCGHLSNVDSAIYMSECVSEKTKAIYLAHLSEECNTPEIAVESYRETFLRKKVPYEDIKIICTHQHTFIKGGDQ